MFVINIIILEINHDFKRVPLSDKIFMKKIEIYNKDKKPDEYEITPNKTITVIINNKNYEISYDAQHNVIIKDSEKKEIKIKSSNSNTDTELTIDNIKLKIFQYKEMEFDGYYSMNNFKVNLFDTNEVDIIYSNITQLEENSFTNSIIEVKLSIKKLDKLIEQIRKDHHYLSKNGIDNSVVLGFINSSDIKNKSYSFNSLKNKKCVIYRIKNSILDGKEIICPIDWDLVKKVNSLNKELKDLKAKIDEIYNLIKDKNENKEDKQEKQNEKKEEIKKDFLKKKKKRSEEFKEEKEDDDE